MGADETSFGPFILDRKSRTLLSGGRPIAIGQRAYSLLEALSVTDAPVDKAALIRAAWPGTIVEEGNLTVQIAALRKALGRRPDGSEWIVTVPRVGYRLARQATVSTSAARKPRLVILPFHNRTGDAGQGHIVDGIADEVTSAMGRFKEITVVPLSADRFRAGADAPRVAQEYDADYVLEGSVRMEGNEVRAAARLINGKDGVSLWSETVTSSDASFAASDHLTGNIAAAVVRTIWWTEIAKATERPDSSAVPDLVRRGVALLELNRMDENRRGVQLVESAIAADPSNARALAMAAWGYEQRIHMGWPLDEGDIPRGLNLARRAITLAGADAGTLAHCAIILQVCGDEWDQGLSVATRALQLNPNDLAALFFGAVAHLKGGSLDEARTIFERALQLGTDAAGNAVAGLAHIALVEGRLQAALDLGRQGVAGRPTLGWVHWPAIAAAAHLGRLDEAAQALATYRAHDPDGRLGRIEFGQRSREPGRFRLVIEGLRLAGMPE